MISELIEKNKFGITADGLKVELQKSKLPPKMDYPFVGYIESGDPQRERDYYTDAGIPWSDTNNMIVGAWGNNSLKEVAVPESLKERLKFIKDTFAVLEKTIDDVLKEMRD